MFWDARRGLQAQAEGGTVLRFHRRVGGCLGHSRQKEKHVKARRFESRGFQELHVGQGGRGRGQRPPGCPGLAPGSEDGGRRWTLEVDSSLEVEAGESRNTSRVF